MSNTRKDLIRAATKLGYRIKKGGKHTLVIDTATEQRITTIPRGYIPKGTLKAILKRMGITEADL
jgi:predicted RNA binding protein YcfA (HicA-like mRNA interferase family)